MAKAHKVILLTGLLLLGACKKDEVVEVDLGYGYFPTAVGRWVEYQVDSLWRDDPSQVLDSVSYRLKQRIEEVYTDDEGRTCQRIHRYVRDEDDIWVVRDVWTMTVGNTAAEMTEENQRRLKMAFAVREGTTWDINVYNTVDELTVAYREVGDPWSANGLTYDNTVLVKNTVAPNFVEKRNFEERYADGVGMVSKYWEETNTQVTYPPPTPENPNPPPIIEVTGWRLDMVAVAHGHD